MTMQNEIEGDWYGIGAIRMGLRLFYCYLFAGRLTEAYDELGNRYTLPPYCSSRPSNMQSEEATPLTPSATSGSQDQVTLKIRLSTNSKDFKCTVSKGDSVGMLKERIQSLHNVEPAKMKMFLSGRLVQDNVLVGDLDIPKGFVIQMIVT